MNFVRYILQSIVLVPIKLLARVFVGLEESGVENLKNIDRRRGVIFASNHKSQADVFFITAAMPYNRKFLPLYFLALRGRHYSKIPWAKYIYGGWVFNLFGGISFKKGLRDYSKALDVHEVILRERRCLCLFPEGKRIFDKDKIGEPHGGTAYLADMTGATIVPVAITGTHDFSFEEFLSGKRKVKVIFGEPKNFGQYLETIPRMDNNYANQVTVYKEISKRVMQDIEVMYKEASGNSK